MTWAVLAVALPSTANVAFGFVALGYAATFLMLHLWRYPFDKERRKSAAPRWAMWLHRGLGYGFVVLYVVMMWRMVPRLWTYQVELPARSVAHLLLGFTIGFLLLVKISILRFFRHFEEWMPLLGVAILWCTTLLVMLSLPTTLREHSLAHGAPGGDPFGPESQQRVARLLPEAGLPATTDLRALATAEALAAGRTVLLEQCTTCHDLKTVIDKPRGPSTWAETVARMAEKPSLFGVIAPLDQARVTAYLIAITPDLQRSAKRRFAETKAPVEDDEAPADAGVRDDRISRDAGVDAAALQPPAIDPAQARATFQRKCSGCHEIADVDGNPPRSPAAAVALVKRMLGNGLKASRRELAQITWWLDAHYVRRAM